MPTSAGAVKDFNLQGPGLRGIVRFDGSAGQRIAVRFSNMTIAGFWATLESAGGTFLATGSAGTQYGTTGALDPVTLPASGTYVVKVDPFGANTGAVRVTVYDGDGPQGLSAAKLSTQSRQRIVPTLPGEGGSVTGARSRVKPRPGARRPRGDAARPPAQVAARRQARVDSAARRRLRRKRASGRRAAPSRAPSRRSRGRARRRRAEPRRSPAPRAPAAPSVASPPTPRFDSGDPPTWEPGRSNRDGDWQSHREESPWTDLPPLRAPPGRTAVAGQALKLDGKPLRGVTVSVEDAPGSARTDETGRFLLDPAPAGRHVLVVNGRTAGSEGQRYGLHEVAIEIARDRTNALEYTVWMSRLDPAGDLRTSYPTAEETVLTTPRIPGLEVRIPKGSYIRDHEGEPVRDLNITAVPVDRPPFPLPAHVQVPVYFTLQPGGAYLSKGARITYPNYNDLPPRQRVDFWQYDPDDRGWHVYGHGSVTADGKQVVPDPNVRIWEFTGAMISSSPAPPAGGPGGGGGGPGGGDPVDLGTGLFVYDKTDLAVDDVIPASLQRTYRPGDTNSYAFGIGTNHSFDLRLWSANNYVDTDLILPHGGRVHYVRTSPGTGFGDAVYEAQTTPGTYFKSRISWNGSGWDLRLRDGTVYVFGDLEPLRAIRDRFGNTLTITRDAGQTGNVTQVTTPHGRWIKFTYDGANRVTEARDNGGHRTAYSYDAAGRLSTATDAGGGTTSYTYDGANQMLSVRDPRNITYLQNTYDSNGRVAEQRMADGGVYTFAYTLDGSGAVTATKVTDPRGSTREVRFNSDGYATSDTAALGTTLEQRASLERQPGTNLVLSATDALNRRTQLGYDASGNVTQVTRLAGTSGAVTTSFAYEPVFNQLATVTDPLGHTTTHGYDARGQLTSLQNGAGQRWTLGYDGDPGLPTSIADPAGKSVQLTYESGDLSRSRDPLGRDTTYFFDSVGHLGSETDPLGRRTRYDHDPLGQTTKVINPAGEATTLAYDGNGNLTRVTDARGNSTAATYDSMDRVASWTDGVARTETYAYDRNGNLTSTTDRRGKVTKYQYDALDRRTFAGFGSSGSTYESTIGYQYDAGNRLTLASSFEGGRFVQSYDGLDRLISQAGPQGTVGYGYDAAGRRTSMTVPGQTATTYAYDNADRLTGVVRGSQSVGLAYDSVGRRSSLTLPNGVQEQYGWDAASQLLSIAYKQGATTLGGLSYEYDPAGRRTAVWGSFARTNLPPAMTGATYDAANRRITQDGTTLAYDGNGNLTSDGTNTYAWSARNELASISGPTTAATFGYDPLGRRFNRTVNGKRTDYVYDGLNVAQERSGTVPTADVLTGLDLDSVFSRTTAGVTRSHLTDALGSTIALTDPLGGVSTSYTYDPFGQTTSTGTASDDPYQYTGRENDGTGLYHYRARYYSPGMERFLTEDPADIVRSDANLYSYVRNDPVSLIDPTGLVDLGPISDAYDAFTDKAQESMEFYAELANDCDSAVVCAGANLGGALSSLATRKNLPATVSVLSLGLGAGPAAAARGPKIFIRRYPNTGGGGVTLKTSQGRRSLDWHRFTTKDGRTMNRPHYDKTGYGPGRSKRHWPWDR
ncbi:MAG TPA: RHS repeat-associated core domain-containing protein [Thermoleophilaceae bacterium]